MISIILLLVVIGFIMYLINTYIPMPAMYKNMLNVFVVIVVILWLLSVFGVFTNDLNSIRVK